MLGRYIDLGNPVAQHPLNVGLVSWWLPLPNNQGGGTLFDLRNRVHGTLTNGPTWSSGKNGLGANRFDSAASQQHIAIPNPGGIVSAAVAVRRTAGGNICVLAYDRTGTQSYNSTFWDIAIFEFAGFWYAQCGTYSSTAESLPDANWIHYVFVADDGTAAPAKIYKNGVLFYSSATAGGGTGTIYHGSIGTGSNSFSGDISDHRAYNRAIHAPEAYAIYEQWLRGHPDTLRRWSRAAWSFGSGGGGASTYTGTGALATDAATIAATATFTAPVYTGSGALSTETTTISGTGTHTAPTYTGTGTPSTEVVTCAGTGTHTAPVYSATGTPNTEVATCAGTGTFTAPVYTATGALATDTTTSAGTGTHTAPTYTGTGSPATDAPTATGSGTFTAPVYTGSASLATDTATLAGSGTFTAPAYTGSGTPSTEVATVAGTGTHTAPPGTYTGTGALACESATCAGTGTFASAASLSPRIVADTVDFAYTQADTVEFAYVHADTVDFVYTIGPDYLE